VANGGGGVSAYTITAGTGELTPVAGSPFAAGTTPSGVTIEPNGQFVYVANGGGDVSAYTVTGGTGVLVPLGAGLGNPFQAGTSPSGIATPGRP
ncbi:MAG: beta-propeller fold lactonase family protein, partial [Nitrospira sp.]